MVTARKVAASVFAALHAATSGIFLFGEEKMDKSEINVTDQVVPVVLERADAVQQAALGWLKSVLVDEYLPPKDMRFFLVPHRADNDCDTAGLSYLVGDLQIDVTQIHHFMSIQVTCSRWRMPAPLSLTEVQDVARRLFRQGETLELTLHPPGDDSGQRGGLRAAVRHGDPWFKRIKWRQDNGRIAFWFMKHPRGPVMAVMTSDLRGNRYWFTKNPSLQQPKGDD